MADDTIVNLGMFDSYEEANDFAISVAASDLPKETMKCYQINHVRVNTVLWDI